MTSAAPSTDPERRPPLGAGPADLRAEPAADLRTGAVRGVLWAAASLGATRLALFVSTLILARLLVPEDFGTVAAAMTVVTYFEVALDLGLGAALIYEQEKGHSARVQTAFTLNVAFSVLLALVGILLAGPLAGFFGVPDETPLFRALACYLVLRGIGQVNDAVLRRDLRFRRRAALDGARAVVRAAVSITLALNGADAWAIAWGILAGEVAAVVVGFTLTRFRPTFELDVRAGRALLTFGGGVVGLKVVSEIGLNADYLVVGGRLGPEALGYYTMAYRLPELVIANALWVFSTVAYPVYSRARTLGVDAFKNAMLRALHLVTLFGFPAGVGLAVVAQDAVHVLFSERWAAAAPAMAVLALASGIGAVGYASGDIFPAAGRPHFLLALNTPIVVLLVVGYFFAAPHGIVAVAAVHLAVSVLYGALRLPLANRLVRGTMREAVRAMRPGVVVSLGVLAGALPVRLLTETGPAGLGLTIAAGTAGGALALAAVDRWVFRDVATLVRARTPGRSG